MLRKFAEGLVFGAGFSLAMVGVAYLSAPVLVSKFPEEQLSALDAQSSHAMRWVQEESLHDLPVDEQIRKASVIILLRYESAPDGMMKAVVQEVPKRDRDAAFEYGIGDEHHSSSYYPEAESERGDGLVVFFTGSPAMERLSVSYRGDRIPGLGNMPIELFRKKCEDNQDIHG